MITAQLAGANPGLTRLHLPLVLGTVVADPDRAKVTGPHLPRRWYGLHTRLCGHVRPCPLCHPMLTERVLDAVCILTRADCEPARRGILTNRM